MPDAPVGRDILLSYVGGVLAVVGPLTYPVGVLKLWIQLHNDYHLSSAVTWYAVSLVPATAVAGQALSLLFWSIAANSVVLALTFIRSLRKAGTTIESRTYNELRGSRHILVFEREAKGVPRQFVRNNPFANNSTIGNVLYSGLGVVLLFEILYFYIRFVDSVLYDFIFVTGFWLLSAGGGALGGYLVTRMPHAEVALAKPREQIRSSEKAKKRAMSQGFARLQERFMSSFRTWLWLGLGIAFLGAILATFCLTAVTKANLPEAVIEEDGKQESIKLLSLSNGYWQGFPSDCRENCQLVAIPDKGDKAKAQIHPRPSSATDPEGIHLPAEDKFFAGFIIMMGIFGTLMLYTGWLSREE